MGLLYVIHRLDPTAVNRIVTEYHRQPELEWPAAKRLFAELGRSQPPDGGSWDEYEERIDSDGWNVVLTVAASEASWDLDKSLDRPGDGLPGIARLLPDLEPIKTLLSALDSFESANVPAAFHPTETGLMGIATDAVIAAAAPVAERYSRPDARQVIGAAPVSLVQRLSGANSTLEAWRKDDYLWDNWCRLMEATHDASARRHWLGLEMA